MALKCFGKFGVPDQAHECCLAVNIEEWVGAFPTARFISANQHRGDIGVLEQSVRVLRALRSFTMTYPKRKSPLCGLVCICPPFCFYCSGSFRLSYHGCCSWRTWQSIEYKEEWAESLCRDRPIGGEYCELETKCVGGIF